MRTTLAVSIASSLLVLSLAGAADYYTRHGFDVTWRVERDGQLFAVGQNVEYRTRFDNVNRPLARYFQAWDYEALGVPDHLPSLDVRIDGWLRVPDGPPLLVRTESPNGTDLRVGGRPAEEGPLPPGEHSLLVFWHGDVQRAFATNWYETTPTSLTLLWGPDEDSLEPVPRSALRPVSGSFPPLRIALFILAPLMALGVGAFVFFALFGTSPEARARRLGIGAFCAVLVLGLGYRLYDYDVMPEFRENPDELFATWNGFQLLTDGTTRGWSLWAPYYGTRVHHETIEYFRQRPFRIIRPYLEHPPALHLLAGAAAKIGGATEWSHAKLKHTRIVPIGLSILTLGLLLAIGRRLDPRGPAPYLAGLLYAVLPMIVLQGRVIKEEALLAPLALGSVLFYLRFRESDRMRDLVVAAVLVGLCPLAKVPGLVFIPVLAMLLTADGKYRQAAIATGIGLAVASLLLLYAALIDWDLFWFTTSKQAGGRPTHFNIFPRFFDDPLVNHNLVGRGWLLFLWIAWAATSLRRGKRGVPVLVLPAIVYLATIAVSSGTWTFGWYLMPIYPFLCLGAGRFLADTWEKPDLVRGGLFIFLAVMYGMNFTLSEDWVREPRHWATIRQWINLLCAGFLVPFALVQAFRHRPFVWLSRASLIVGVALLVGLSGYFVARYDVFYDEHRDFDRNLYFDR